MAKTKSAAAKPNTKSGRVAGAEKHPARKPAALKAAKSGISQLLAKPKKRPTTPAAPVKKASLGARAVIAKTKPASKKPRKAAVQALCVTCRRRQARAGRKSCATCADETSAYFVNVRDEARKNGKCTACRKRKARKNFITCKKCADRTASRADQVRDEAERRGDCIVCTQNRVRPGLSPKTGLAYKTCEACNESAKERVRASRAAAALA